MVPRRRGDRAPHPRVHPLERGGDGLRRQPSRASRSAGTSRPTSRRPASTRSASTTSSAARTRPGGGDQIYIQGHGSPGIYARAYLEGRLTEEQLLRFRQEVQHGVGKGLPSYPHPRLMPEFWEFPTVSMGLTGDQLDLPGPVQPLHGRTAASRTPRSSTCGRSSATARWPSPSRSVPSASPPARSSTTSPGSSTATCSSSTGRCAATARSSRSSSRSSAAPAGT